MPSLAYAVAQHPEVLEDLSPNDLEYLEHSWAFWARPEQLEPPSFESGAALIWLLSTGRGWGKTLTGAQSVRARVNSGRIGHVALISNSAADVRDVMIEGSSGLRSISSSRDPAGIPRYEPSKRRVAWENGAVAHMYSAEDPEQLRGPEHDFAWCDELTAWAKQTRDDTWSNLMFGLRMGTAQCIITTTPRPVPLYKRILKMPRVVVTHGTTYENLINLSDHYKIIIAEYEGTRLGSQELLARLMEDVPGALWTLDMLERSRMSPDSLPPLKRKVVAVDPSGSRGGHECGIVVAGIDYADPPHGYLLADRSGRYSPNQWASTAGRLYDAYEADRIVVEVNFGAELVTQTLVSVRPDIPAPFALRAAQGKRIRAEPVAALMEQSRIHHVGQFPELEAQLSEWLPEDGPNDRLDAYVWAFQNLLPSRRKGKLWFA